MEPTTRLGRHSEVHTRGENPAKQRGLRLPPEPEDIKLSLDSLNENMPLPSVFELVTYRIEYRIAYRKKNDGWFIVI